MRRVVRSACAAVARVRRGKVCCGSVAERTSWLNAQASRAAAALGANGTTDAQPPFSAAVGKREHNPAKERGNGEVANGSAS